MNGMKLGDLKEFAANANADQREAIGFMAKWLNEMSPQYCTCSVNCNQDCEIVESMGKAFQTALEK